MFTMNLPDLVSINQTWGPSHFWAPSLEDTPPNWAKLLRFKPTVQLMSCRRLWIISVYFCHVDGLPSNLWTTYNQLINPSCISMCNVYVVPFLFSTFSARTNPPSSKILSPFRFSDSAPAWGILQGGRQSFSVAGNSNSYALDRP